MRICKRSSFLNRLAKGLGLSFFLVMILSAEYASGQDLGRKITLSLDSASLEQSINEIAKKSRSPHEHPGELLSGNTKRVTVASQLLTTGEALSLVLSGTGLRYRVVEGYIVVEAAPVRGNVTGRVFDGEGRALSGVSVHLKGTKSGDVTDENGSFSLPVPEKGATLVFSMVGFQAKGK